MNKSSSSFLFRVNDYSGREVLCSDYTWNHHIVAGHNQMYGNVQAVKDTIQSPDKVFDSDSISSSEVFYKYSNFSSYKLMTTVIVNYDGDTGYVSTAYPVKKIPSKYNTSDSKVN